MSAETQAKLVSFAVAHQNTFLNSEDEDIVENFVNSLIEDFEEIQQMHSDDHPDNCHKCRRPIGLGYVFCSWDCGRVAE